jgi:hypothetical protein
MRFSSASCLNRAPSSNCIHTSLLTMAEQSTNTTINSTNGC